MSELWHNSSGGLDSVTGHRVDLDDTSPYWDRLIRLVGIAYAEHSWRVLRGTGLHDSEELTDVLSDVDDIFSDWVNRYNK